MKMMGESTCIMSEASTREKEESASHPLDVYSEEALVSLLAEGEELLEVEGVRHDVELLDVWSLLPR